MATSPPPRRTRIEDIRRIEIIEAAHRVFLVGGFNALTTTRICKEAGMSQGILTYYFKSKDEVLFEMVRYANRLLMDEVTRRLRQAETSWERLAAIVEGIFPEAHFEPNIANAWVSFYAATAENQRYARLQNLFYRRLRSNLASALGDTLSSPELDHFSLGFAAMVDGLWLGRGQNKSLEASEATALLMEYSEKMLGTDRVSALKKKPGQLHSSRTKRKSSP
ncbi:transcriptional regulator BetI [Aquamicrobium soli]|uniref:Transcriptional regulator BetI n=1 Tax=Aquamicrobium soli TaxID=1811518 RepID=A0ABV7K7M0_9HYPH